VVWQTAMAPLRYSRLKRYRISNDVLMSILEWLDPRSLFMASKVTFDHVNAEKT
jgi:hypothetical protein